MAFKIMKIKTFPSSFYLKLSILKKIKKINFWTIFHGNNDNVIKNNEVIIFFQSVNFKYVVSHRTKFHRNWSNTSKD